MYFGKHISHLMGFHCKDDYIGVNSQFSIVSSDRNLIDIPEVMEPILVDVTNPYLVGSKTARLQQPFDKDFTQCGPGDRCELQ